MQNSESDLQNMEERVQSLTQELQMAVVRRKELDEAFTVASDNSEVTHLEEEEARLAKESLTVNSELSHKRKELKQAVVALRMLRENLVECEAALDTKQAEITAQEKVCVETQERKSELTEQLEDLQRLAGELVAGGNDSQGQTLTSQAMDARKEVKQAETQIKSANLKLKHLGKQLSTKQTEAQKVKRADSALDGKLAAAATQAEKAHAALHVFSFDQELVRALTAEKKQGEQNLRRLHSQVEKAAGAVSSLRFEHGKDYQLG